MTTATISVVTPNYNHADRVGAAIRSVAAQTRPPLEHIVVDDGSTDASLSVIAELARAFPGVRLIPSEQNNGAALAMARGAREARGEFVMYLGADDLLPPNSLELFGNVLSAHPDAPIICGDVHFVDERARRHWERRYLNVDAAVYLTPDVLVDHQRRGLYVVNGGAAVVRRDILIKSNMTDPLLRWYLDFVHYNVIAYRYGLFYIPNILHEFTVTGSNLSAGAQTWSAQEPVLGRLFDVLNEPANQDIRHMFRRSAILAVAPHILRYMFLHKEARAYCSTRLVFNSLAISFYRSFRNWVPAWLLTKMVELGTSRTALDHKTGR